MTEVGTPRRETLIDSLDGRTSNPTQFNPSCRAPLNTGYMLALSHLWEMNTTTGEQFGGMAEICPNRLTTTTRISASSCAKTSSGATDSL